MTKLVIKLFFNNYLYKLFSNVIINIIFIINKFLFMFYSQYYVTGLSNLSISDSILHIKIRALNTVRYRILKQRADEKFIADRIRFHVLWNVKYSFSGPRKICKCHWGLRYSFACTDINRICLQYKFDGKWVLFLDSIYFSASILSIFNFANINISMYK